MTEWTYYGGPMDGAKLTHVPENDYVLIAIEDKAYYYIRCTDGHKYFEYAGETEEWYE